MSDMVPRSRLEREKSARKEAERLLEEKSRELYHKNQDLLNLSSELEQKVLERTAQLEKARDEALAANQLKDAFLANMSHELRTPLTAVIGFAQNIEAGILTSQETDTAIDNIIGNGQHLLSLLNEILDISKVASGQLTVAATRFSLTRMLNEIESIFADICKEKGLRFECNLPDNLPCEVTSDPTRLKQVLMNLLGNAVKFTDQGRVSLDVKFNDANQQIQFVVRDTGIGISEANLPQLFKPFVQADNTSSRQYGGTGLGLSISKSLTQLMGGDIQVTSAINKGSEFIATIKCPGVFFEAQMSPDLGESENWETLHGTVLMVEDNEMNQLLIGQNLTAMGLDFHIEENGELGYQAALAGDYDLVLMDIQMPVMDGKEAINILRSVGYNTPVIALTANVMPEDISQYKQLGFNTWLGKPINREKFYQTLVQYLPKKLHAKTGAIADLDIYDKLFKQFKTKLPEYANELQAALMAQDDEAAERVLHQLKGLCGNFELDDLTQMVTDTYSEIRAKDLQNVADKVKQIVGLMRHIQ